jgi:IclR family mhp operon transcriptional activator
MKDASIRSIERAIAVLQAINRAGGLKIADIALAANLPYPTVFVIVNTLVAEGLMKRSRRARSTDRLRSCRHFQAAIRRMDGLSTRQGPILWR